MRCILNFDKKDGYKTLERCLSYVERVGLGFGLPLLIMMECVAETPGFIRKKDN